MILLSIFVLITEDSVSGSILVTLDREALGEYLCMNSNCIPFLALSAKTSIDAFN